MQIKIRVWDKDSETMIYGVGITPESDGGIPYQIPVNAHDFDQFDYYPNSIIMLYTGLKDKNGTEIYEGDVLELDLSEYAGLEGLDIFIVRSDHFHGDVCYLQDICQSEENTGSKRIRVIGNIYEHPHLLGGEEQ